MMSQQCFPVLEGGLIETPGNLRHFSGRIHQPDCFGWLCGVREESDCSSVALLLCLADRLWCESCHALPWCVLTLPTLPKI